MHESDQASLEYFLEACRVCREGRVVWGGRAVDRGVREGRASVERQQRSRRAVAHLLAHCVLQTRSTGILTRSRTDLDALGTLVCSGLFLFSILEILQYFLIISRQRISRIFV